MTSDGWADEVLVADLERAGTLLVQDGNHGANRPVGEEILVGVRGISHVRAADISDDGRIDFRGSQQLAASAYDRIKKGRAKGGDTLLCHKGTVGPVARVPDDAPSLLCSPQTTFWRSLDHGRIDPGYLYYLLRSPFFQAQLVRRMHESDMAPYVSLTAQRSLILRLPEISEQRRAAGVLEALDRKMEANIALQERLIGTADLLFAHVCDDARKQGVEAVAATELLHVNPSVPISKGANTPFLEMAGTAPWAVRPERLGARPFTGGCKFTRGDTLVAKITGCIEHGKGAFVDLGLSKGDRR
jgi:type I restriction enzyme S subunit